MPDPVAGRELADVAGLDAFPERGGDVVAHRGLGADRPGQAPERDDPRIDAHRRGGDVAMLPAAQAEPVARADRDRAQVVHPAPREAQLVAPFDRVARAQGHHRAMAAGSKLGAGRKRAQQLDQGDGRAGRDRHRDRHGAALEEPIARDPVGDRAARDRDGAGQRGEHQQAR